MSSSTRIPVPTPPAQDGRLERSRKAVLTATLELLSEVGLGGVTIDEVSKRSGVAKTTIYRHWPSRSALLITACSTLGTKLEPSDTGALEEDLFVLLTSMAYQLGRERWASVLPSIIDAAERDPELARLHAQLHEQFMAALQNVVERAQYRGELSQTMKSSEMVAMLAGALFYRRWFSREPLGKNFVRSLIAHFTFAKASEVDAQMDNC